MLVGNHPDMTETRFLDCSPERDDILACTVMPAKSDSDVVFCLQLLSKILTYTLRFCLFKSIDHLCINPIRRIGLIHKRSIDSKSLITL